MAFDRARHRLILFGGSRLGLALDDTWIMDLENRTWRQVAMGGATRPAARFSMVSGIDAMGGRFLIATGQGQGAVFFNDVWSFDLATETWSQVPGEGARPSERYGSAGGIYEQGGFAPAGTEFFVTHGFTNHGRFQDTRALNVTQGVWEDLTPMGTLPVQRCLHAAAAIDPTGFAIFGGCASGFGPCPLDDTWRFDAAKSTWTDLTGSVRPPARYFSALLTLGEGGDLLLFGGFGASGFLGDSWKLERDGWEWIELAPSGTPPSPRDGHSVAWVSSLDPALTGSGCGSAVVFGGGDTSGELNDAWILEPTAVPAAPMLAGAVTAAGARFTWTADPAALEYEAWRSERPEFAPSDPGLTPLPGLVYIDGTGSFVDSANPGPGEVFYYRVRLGRCAGY